MPVVSLSPLHFSEGIFTIDVAIRFLNATLLNPALSVLLPVGAIAHTTGLFAARSLSGAVDHLKSADWHPILAQKEVKWAIGIWAVGLALKINEQLNRAARNNFTKSKKGWKAEEEIVLVTGGAGGLGSDVVSRFARRGAKVVVLDIAPLAADAPAGVKHYKVDLASKDAVQEAAKKVIAEVGYPTVLINMAGIVRAQTILDLSARDVDLTYDINVKSHYYTVQAFLPHMIQEGKGHVVTIASSVAYIQAAVGVSYCSSKAAALSFHEGLTEELRHCYQPASNARAIRTSVICPAHFKTGMFAGFANTLPEPLAPSLEISTVAKLVEETVLSGESQHIIEPFYAKCTPIGRGLPTWLYAILLRGAKDAMGLVRATKAKEARAD
ncbi:hypothetical protein JCM11641_008298 [Rhodosporidiobolus odoratus]